VPLVCARERARFFARGQQQAQKVCEITARPVAATVVPLVCARERAFLCATNLRSARRRRRLVNSSDPPKMCQRMRDTK